MTVEVKKLSRADYWEWRASVEEVDRARLESELARVKSIAASNNLKAAQFEFELLKIETVRKIKESEDTIRNYKKFVEDLEGRVGFSIRDRVIDPITFEVKEI